MLGFLIDTRKGTAGAVEFEREDGSYNRLIGCDMLQFQERSVGGKYFDLITDEEALNSDNPVISAFNSKRECMQVGNILVLGLPEEGSGTSTSLTAEDVKLIEAHTLGAFLKDGRSIRILECEY